MPRLPWKAISPVSRDVRYVVITTETTLRRHRDLGRFSAAAQELWAGLEAADGLIGYELRAAPISKRLTTVSAWRDEPALTAFTTGDVHRQAVAATRPLITDSRIHHTTRTGKDLPATAR